MMAENIVSRLARHKDCLSVQCLKEDEMKQLPKMWMGVSINLR